MQVQVLIRIHPASKIHKAHFELLECKRSTSILDIKREVLPISGTSYPDFAYEQVDQKAQPLFYALLQSGKCV